MKRIDHVSGSAEYTSEFNKGVQEFKVLIGVDFEPIGNTNFGNLTIGYQELWKIVEKLKEFPSVDRNKVIVGGNSQRTSIKAAERAFPRSGTQRRAVYNLVHIHGGLIDEELEEKTNGKHQSISSARRSLVIDGFIVDSGYTRKNKIGNDCIIWVTTVKPRGR